MAARKSTPPSGLRMRGDRAGIDEMLVEQIAVCYQRMGHNIRELEAWKLKRGYCVMGISCTEKAIEGAMGGKRGCAHHHAAQKSGIRLAKWKTYDTEYGKLQKIAKEKAKAAREEEAAAEAAREARNGQIVTRTKGRRAA